MCATYFSLLCMSILNFWACMFAFIWTVSVAQPPLSINICLFHFSLYLFHYILCKSLLNQMVNWLKILIKAWIKLL